MLFSFSRAEENRYASEQEDFDFGRGDIVAGSDQYSHPCSGTEEICGIGAKALYGPGKIPRC